VEKVWRFDTFDNGWAMIVPEKSNRNLALSGLHLDRGRDTQGCALGCRILPFQGINYD
jgi:hypothetical protein